VENGVVANDNMIVYICENDIFSSLAGGCRSPHLRVGAGLEDAIPHLGVVAYALSQRLRKILLWGCYGGSGGE
jgi:hypothetical protein